MTDVATRPPKSLKLCSEMSNPSFPTRWVSPLQLRPCLECVQVTVPAMRLVMTACRKLCGLPSLQAQSSHLWTTGPQMMLFCTAESPGEATSWRWVSISLTFSQYLFGVSLFKKKTLWVPGSLSGGQEHVLCFQWCQISKSACPFGWMLWDDSFLGRKRMGSRSRSQVRAVAWDCLSG